MHCRKSQSKVRLKFYDLNLSFVDVLVAEFREPIKSYIPKVITFLNDSELNVRRAGAGALAKLSDQGKVENFGPERC